MHASLGSTQQSFDVQPRYHSRPRVKIEATIQPGEMKSPTSISKSPSRPMAEFKAHKVQVDGVFSNDGQGNNDPTSPTLRGSKLNMSKQASLKAVKGYDRSPAYQR